MKRNRLKAEEALNKIRLNYARWMANPDNPQVEAYMRDKNEALELEILAMVSEENAFENLHREVLCEACNKLLTNREMLLYGTWCKGCDEQAFRNMEDSGK